MRVLLMITRFTSAPDAYDYPSVRTLAHAKDKEGASYRLIQVLDQKKFEEFQVPRYESGFYSTVIPTSHEAKARFGGEEVIAGHLRRGRIVLEMMEAKNRLDAAVKHLDRAAAMALDMGLRLDEAYPHQDVMDATESLASCMGLVKEDIHK